MRVDAQWLPGGPAPSRTLAVTGDDFGLAPGVNAGIVHAHLHGILTHASLMAGARFAAAALRLARQTPSLAVGVHLVLADGRPVLPARRAATLVDVHGRFRPTAGEFVRRWVAGRVNADEAESELRAQIEWLLEAGFRPTHLDSHKHVHMWPPVFRIVARLAQEYGIPIVRLSIEKPIGRLVVENRSDPEALRQAAQNLLMAPLAWVNRRALARHGLAPSWFLGRVHTGLLSVRRLERALARVPPGRAELMTHPGYVDETLTSVKTRLRVEREAEVALLCAREAREAVVQAGFRLDRAMAGEAGLVDDRARPA